jgi:hypothetical protein
MHVKMQECVLMVERVHTSPKHTSRQKKKRKRHQCYLVMDEHKKHLRYLKWIMKREGAWRQCGKDMSKKAQIRHLTDRLWDVIVDLMVWKDIGLLICATRACPWRKRKSLTRGHKRWFTRSKRVVWWKIRHNDTPHIHATCIVTEELVGTVETCRMTRRACNDPSQAYIGDLTINIQ